MPHRAGYFAFAYQWDHHCHDLIQSIKDRFNQMLRELGSWNISIPRMQNPSELL